MVAATVITGRWGKPSDVLLDLVVAENGKVHGVANPGRQNGIHSIILFADLGNPTIGFYDRLGGERLVDDRGQFGGGYAWRDVRTLMGSDETPNRNREPEGNCGGSA